LQPERSRLNLRAPERRSGAFRLTLTPGDYQQQHALHSYRLQSASDSIATYGAILMCFIYLFNSSQHDMTQSYQGHKMPLTGNNIAQLTVQKHCT